MIYVIQAGVEKVKTVQTAMRLPSEMHERLKQSQDGVSEEVRGRLQQSFDVEDRYDPQTRELGADICELARLLRDQAKFEWHQHPEVHAALTAAIAVCLESRAPKLEGVPPAIRGFKPGHGANVGSVLATNFIHNRAAEKKRQAEIEQLEARLAQLKTGGKP
jgi:hypothetical protein